MQKQKNSHLLGRLLLLGLFIVALLLLLRYGDGCPIRKLIGIPCPGCGLSRAWLAVFRLDFQAAFRRHPMFWSVPVLMAYCLFSGGRCRKNWLYYGPLAVIALGFSIRYIYVLIAFFSGVSVV